MHYVFFFFVYLEEEELDFFFFLWSSSCGRRSHWEYLPKSTATEALNSSTNKKVFSCIFSFFLSLIFFLQYAWNEKKYLDVYRYSRTMGMAIYLYMVLYRRRSTTMHFHFWRLHRHYSFYENSGSRNESWAHAAVRTKNIYANRLEQLREKQGTVLKNFKGR